MYNILQVRVFPRLPIELWSMIKTYAEWEQLAKRFKEDISKHLYQGHLSNLVTQCECCRRTPIVTRECLRCNRRVCVYFCTYQMNIRYGDPKGRSMKKKKYRGFIRHHHQSSYFCQMCKSDKLAILDERLEIIATSLSRKVSELACRWHVYQVFPVN